MKIIKNKVPNKKNTVVIIVTYFPDNGLHDRVSAVKSLFDKILIVDNASNDLTGEYVKNLISMPEVNIIFNAVNVGIASALNQGIRKVISSYEDIEWVLTLDQDTLVFPDFLKNLQNTYLECPYQAEVGIIGSNYEEKTTQKQLHTPNNSKSIWEEVKNLPSSGSLISMKAFEVVGSMREDFFIDYVDTEYCMRMRKAGFKILISNNVSMLHPLGYYKYSVIHKLIAGRSLVTDYPAIRHYYWTRNGLILVLEQMADEPRWALSQLWYLLVRRILIIFIFESKKIEKLSVIARGLMDALRKKMGPFKPK